jgi:BASS family bile acid:Na+ symporter
VLLSKLLFVSVQTFAVASMLAVGSSFSVRQIFGPLRHGRGVVRVLLANFILVPLFAELVIRLLALDRPLAIGLMLVATGAGAPFLIKLTAAANADVALGATLLVLLVACTALYMPFVVPRSLPGVTTSAGAIAMPLALTMLLPLGVGLAARASAPTWTQRLRPVLQKIASAALVTLVITTCVVHFRAIASVIGTAAIPSALLLIVGAFLIGYLTGGSGPDVRAVIGLATGQRNIAAATVVATDGFDDARTLVMVVIASLVGLAVLFTTATVLKKRLRQHS